MTSVKENTSGSRDPSEVVRDGYDVIARSYREQKDESTIKLQAFREWLARIQKGPVLELGCGSGFPVAMALFNEEIEYLGIDVSQSQIALAKKQFPERQESFVVAEMIDFARDAPSQAYGGIIALFAISHLERVHHVELFTHLKRMLKRGGYILFNNGFGGEGYDEEWLGAPMFWSSFSTDWYEKTALELGFEVCLKQRNVSEFRGEEETMWYLLLRKP